MVNAVIERGLQLSSPPAASYRKPKAVGFNEGSAWCFKSTHTSILPLLGGIGDDLSDTLRVEGCSLCTGNGKGEQEDLGNTEHCKENGEGVKTEARLKVGRREVTGRCPRRTR